MYEFGQLGTGLSWFRSHPKADELFFLKSQRHPWGECLSYSHSRKLNLPVTHSCPFIVRGLAYSFFPRPLKPHCQGRVMGFISGGINISAAFDVVNHQGILYRIYSVGIGGSVLSILTQFLSNRSQHVMVDGCRNKLVDVVSGVPQGCVLGLLLFILCTLEVFVMLENKLIGYADDCFHGC